MSNGVGPIFNSNSNGHAHGTIAPAGPGAGGPTVQLTSSAVQVADTGLATISSDLQQINTLVNEAGLGQYSQPQLNNLQRQINQLVNDINQTAQTTQSGGTHLLDGSLASGATVTYGGITQNVTIPALTAAALQLNQIDVHHLTYGPNGQSTITTIDQPIVSAAVSEVNAAMISLQPPPVTTGLGPTNSNAGSSTTSSSTTTTSSGSTTTSSGGGGLTPTNNNTGVNTLA